jgi:branched-chain amino acid transport system permease protein
VIAAVKTIGFALAVALVAIVPSFVDDFRAFRLATVGAYVIALLGLIVVTGYTGQISLGHGAFMAVGGYTTAILMAKHGVQDVRTIPIAGLVAGLAGLLVGLPALRLSGLYLALATFGIAISVPSVLKKYEGFTGGTTGLNLFAIPEQTGGGVDVSVLGRTLTNNDWLYYLTWTIAVAGFAVAWALLGGRLGRGFRAVRDSEIAAASSGVNNALAKTIAFGISAFYGGIAGSLLAISTAYVNPDTFPIALSITLIVGAAVGGLQTLVGAVFGAFFIVYMPLYAEKVSKTAPSVVYGVVLVLVMLLVPVGVGGLLARAFGRLKPLLRRQRRVWEES